MSYFQCNSCSPSGHNLIRNATKITKSRLLSVAFFHINQSGIRRKYDIYIGDTMVKTRSNANPEAGTSSASGTIPRPSGSGSSSTDGEDDDSMDVEEESAAVECEIREDELDAQSGIDALKAEKASAAKRAKAADTGIRAAIQ